MNAIDPFAGKIGERQKHILPRRAKARQEAALAIETAQRRALLDRAARFVAELQAELAEAARCQVVAASIIGELAAQLIANDLALGCSL